MTIAIVAEKPSIAREIAPFARRHWPDEQIVTLCAIPYGPNYRMTYPRGLGWNDYPRLALPEIRLAPMGANWQPMLVDTQGRLSPCEVVPSFLERVSSVVNACDPDVAGTMAFALLMEDTFGADALRQRHFPSLRLVAIDEDSLTQAFANMGDFAHTCAEMLAYGRVKRYFDFNWNMNALVILGATARASGLPPNGPPLSKYAVQLLLWLSSQTQPLTQGRILDRMHRWEGTGRYNTRVEMGSAASRGQILEQMQANGLLHAAAAGDASPGHAAVQLTQRAHTLVALLHKDMRDADLPFRLDAWCQQGLSDARPAIDKYILTVFGKQKRFLDARR